MAETSPWSDFKWLCDAYFKLVTEIADLFMEREAMFHVPSALHWAGGVCELQKAAASSVNYLLFWKDLRKM